MVVCLGRALPANLRPKNTGALGHMNIMAAKYAKWRVRVLGPKVVGYSSMARGEAVRAQKSQCVLVPRMPDQLMLGLVSFDSKYSNAASSVAQDFVADSVWELTTPAVHTRPQPGPMGAPPRTWS